MDREIFGSHGRFIILGVVSLIIVSLVVGSLYHPVARFSIDFIECSVTSDKEVYYYGEEAAITFKVENTGPFGVTIHFKDGDWSSWVVRSVDNDNDDDDDGYDSYAWKDGGGLVSSDPYDFTLESGEDRTFTLLWDFMDYRGGGCTPSSPYNISEPGTYVIEYTLNLDSDYYGDRALKAFQEIELVPTPYEILEPEVNITSVEGRERNMSWELEDDTMAISVGSWERFTDDEVSSLWISGRSYENGYRFFHVSLPDDVEQGDTHTRSFRIIKLTFNITAGSELKILDILQTYEKDYYGLSNRIDIDR